MSLSADYYLASVPNAALKEKYTSSNITIPLKEEGEEVVIDAQNDLPEDSSELSALLTNEECKCEYWLLVAKAYAAIEQYSEAEAVIQQAFQSPYVDKNDAKTQSSLHNFLAWLSLARKDTESADREIQESLSIIPSNEVGLLAQVVSRFSSLQNKGKRSNFEKETRLADTLLRNSRNCYALLIRAQIFFYRENYLAALKVFQKVLMLNPLLRPDPRIGIGICYWFLDRKDLAARAWHNSVFVNKKNNVEGKLLTCLAKFDQCFSQSLSDEEFETQYKAALELTQAVYAEDSQNLVVLVVLASLYFMKGEHSTVQKVCDHVVAVNSAPNFVKSDAAFWKARSLFSQVDFSDKTESHKQVHAAQKGFAEAIKFNEDNVLAHFGYAQCLVVRRQVNDAIREFEKIRDMRPQSLEVTYALGMLYAKSSSRYRKTAVENLEKYVKLAVDKQEPVALSAYFTLSRLYEDTNISKALEFLEAAKEQEVKAGKTDKEISYALLNNIGAISVLCDKQGAEDSFVQAQGALEETDAPIDAELKKASAVTLKYNVARAAESRDSNESMQIYEQILEECPHYTSAKIRYLLLACVSQDKHIKEELDSLMSQEPDNLELRSFYGWYLKNYGRRHHLSPSDQSRDLESTLHRETLVKYTSHDLYALISLANVYSSLAREVKDPRKKEQYYVRAAQLYQKVLSLDPKDVYAAQGIAIIFAQKKQTGLALEIFRRVRDSLNTKAVFINLAHCLLEAKQYAKAIENYNLALERSTDGKDTQLLNFVSRAWLYRGIQDQSLDSLKKSLEIEKQAYTLKSNISFKYNVAYIQFQLADFLRRQPNARRSMEDLEWVSSELNKAILSLNELVEDPEHKPPYPAEDLKLRSEMAAGLVSQLEKAIEDQKQFESSQASRLEEARKKHEEEEKLQLEEKQKAEEKQRAEEERMAAERKKLDEQQEEWNKLRIEEAKDQKDQIDAEDQEGTTGGKKKRAKKPKKKEDFIVSDEDEQMDEDLFGDESEKEEEEDSKKRKSESSSPAPKRRLKKNGGSEAAEKEEEESAEATPEAEANAGEGADAEPIKRRSNKILDDEDEE